TNRNLGAFLNNRPSQRTCDRSGGRPATCEPERDWGGRDRVASSTRLRHSIPKGAGSTLRVFHQSRSRACMILMPIRSGCEVITDREPVRKDLFCKIEM